jgi:hypothetical protein
MAETAATGPLPAVGLGFETAGKGGPALVDHVA